MPELPKTIEEALSMAIAAEIDAQSTYLHLAELTKKPEVIVLYQNLARDERWHRETLEERFHAIVGEKKPSPISASIEGATARRKAKPEMDEMEILFVAIDAEKSAFDFYIAASKMTPESETKEMFLRLSQDEKRHRELLEKEVQGRQGKPTDEFELDSWVKE